jgi:hypothetical protein
MSYLALHPAQEGQSVVVCGPGQKPAMRFENLPFCAGAESPGGSPDKAAYREFQILLWSLLLVPLVGFYYAAREIAIQRARLGLPLRQGSIGNFALGMLCFPVLAARLQMEVRDLSGAVHGP